MSLFNFFYAVPRFETSIFPNSVKAMRLTQQVHCFELPPPFRLELILDLRGQLFVSGIVINAFNFFFSQFWQPLILYSVKAWGDHFPPLQWQVNISLCTPSSRTKKFYHFDSVILIQQWDLNFDSNISFSYVIVNVLWSLMYLIWL